MTIKTVTSSKVVKTKSFITTDGKSFTSKEQAERYQHDLDYERVNLKGYYKTLQEARDYFQKQLDLYGDCELNYYYDDDPYIEVKKS